MINTEEVTTSEDFYERVYASALSSRNPSIRVYSGCQVTRDSAGRTISLTLSFATKNNILEHRIIETEDHEGTRSMNDRSRAQQAVIEVLDSLTEYLTSKRRIIPVSVERKGSYIEIKRE